MLTKEHPLAQGAIALAGASQLCSSCQSAEGVDGRWTSHVGGLNLMKGFTTMPDGCQSAVAL
jgi:hypothetical protein